MRKLLSALALSALAANPALARTETTLYRGSEVVAAEVLVTVDEAMQPAELADIVAREGLELARVRLDNGLAVEAQEYLTHGAALRPTRFAVVKLDPALDSIDSAIARLEGYPGVLSAGPNHLRWTTFTPNDPRYSSQWGLPKIGAPAAWDITMGTSNILVAIVDTGLDYNHPDFNKSLYRADLGRDTVNDDFDPFDDHGHGTHVGGTVAEWTNNGVGAAGVAPGVSLMGVKVLAKNGSGTDETVAAGIDWAREKGAHVINMSLGGSEPSAPMSNAVQAAYDAGVFLACATGNDNGKIGYPAADPGCTAVGATNSSNGRAYFSNYGPQIDIAAPGTQILSMYKGSYASLDGTSMATPHVAGVAALVFSVSATGTSGVAVRNTLTSTAQDLGTAGWDQFFGHGLVRADRAVAAAAGN
jgi:thermitase